MVTTGVLLATPLGPTVSTTPASSTSSVTQPIISVRRTDRRPQSFEEGQQSSEASSVYREGSQTGFRKCYSFRGGQKKKPGALDILRLQQRSSTLHWPPMLGRLSRTIAPSFGSCGELSHKKSRKSFFMNYQ
ncbi:hypothetical protein ACFX11_019077 [Malus domestica]